MFFGARRYMTGGNLFRTLLEIEVSRIQPRAAKGRPRQLHFDEAFDFILRVVRTGMQWQQLHLQPPTVSHITVFKTMYTWMRHSALETANCRLLRLCRRCAPAAPFLLHRLVVCQKHIRTRLHGSQPHRSQAARNQALYTLLPETFPTSVSLNRS